MTDRRFPPPWSVDDPETKLAKPASSSATPTATRSPMHTLRTSRAGDRRQYLMTRDEARRIAANIAKLPELLQKPSLS